MEKVLLVEDDGATRTALRSLLEDAGYSCREATDGAEALEALQGDGVDLILLDRRLPRVSGAEVRAAVRADPRTMFTPIVFLSAQRERGAKLAELAAGADDYITKPFDAEELLARVGATLRRTAALRGLNPLSGLPGNTTITAEIESRLAQHEPFALLYVDIDRFKEFNDHYGFARGDEMITGLASLLVEVAGGAPRFVGHIGGDDFVVLAGAGEASRLASAIARRFDEVARELYDRADRERGATLVKDRKGMLRRTPLATVSIGIVPVRPGRFSGAASAARAAAEVKEVAKRHPGSSWAVDRRKK